jgi:hypothetical protein
MKMKLVAVAGVLALCVSAALAQHRADISSQTVFRAPRPNSAFNPNGRRGLIGLSGVPLGEGHRNRRFSRDSLFYGGGWPYFPPEYDAYGPEPVAAVPQVAPIAPIPATKQEPIPAGALLELQGDRWVKVSSFATGVVPPETSQGISSSGAAAAPVKELPPAILVYHDGHTEELSSYSIIGVTIYTKADYWTSGAWTRKIQIADLDLPATLKQNHDRGLAFQLPSGPDEVILRP